ncbi:sulfurtransferase-like selenium metabolism protein YedF [Candidatus Sulfurimonas baltica]|uniref:Sulfurtransferase-like selenium metabolism protein YedF n=1 Tax=Candidatus Sulfurimonas baltica TaxID=2740404 RepID=A0A7S7LTL3_9BACT|nr:sulfurtransferase-like selenium metabolism protein YedF [Candidatus Sulfurimonas baltica]QOY51130.1 sulfurtransferase-like selenium metabolism protein YedF [Candidatus Sulfurimonas baltica]
MKNNTKAPTPTHRLDMHGEPCPYPAIKTLEALRSLDDDDILEIISDCPQSINNIPMDVQNHGFQVLHVDTSTPSVRYFVKR